MIRTSRSILHIGIGNGPRSAQAPTLPRGLYGHGKPSFSVHVARLRAFSIFENRTQRTLAPHSPRTQLCNIITSNIINLLATTLNSNKTHIFYFLKSRGQFRSTRNRSTFLFRFVDHFGVHAVGAKFSEHLRTLAPCLPRVLEILLAHLNVLDFSVTNTILRYDLFSISLNDKIIR